MADTDYSSLRQAIDKIIGAPAGGTPSVQDAVALAPKTPYSQDLQTVAPGGIKTTSAISNTEFDPYAAERAEQAASLAAIQAQTAALTAPAATVPAVATSSNDAYINNLLRAGRTNEAAVAGNMIKAQGGTAKTPSTGFLTDPNYVFKPPQVATARTATARAPVNPGANAPWQKSQQYWKDLAAYKGT